MKRVELYARVRHAVMIEGLSQREAARRFGIDPRTVKKMLRYPPRGPTAEGNVAVRSEPVLIDLDAPETWPVGLVSFLESRHDLFLGWETERIGGEAYEKAINGLSDVLVPYAIRGWHCTRLTDEEIASILTDGLQLPDAPMLYRRIDAVVKSGALDPSFAAVLKARNQAHERNRAGILWFCFFEPRIAGEHGIERFFRHWGGEALYNSHESDSVTSPSLRAIGTPSVIEALVPIASLERHGGLSFKVVRRFLISRGYSTIEPVEHEDRIKRPLPAENIRRVSRFPDAEFMALTGCSGWGKPLGQ